MKDFVYQTNKNECGFACLKMLLASLYKDERYLYLLPTLKNQQYSLLDLKEIAKKYGLVLGGYLVNNTYELIKDHRPFILIKKLANGAKHAILVKKPYQKFSLVYDPNLGKKIVSNKKLFMDISNGVEVLTVESFTKTSLSYEIKPLISKKERIKITTLETLAILSYFFSAYFIDHESHFLYPIILMVVGVLFAIAYKISTYNVMNHFDDEFIRYTYHNDKKIREENYRLMHQTKSGLLATTNNIILTLASALAINVILVLQSYYAIFVIISAMILVCIDAFLIMPRIKTKMEELERVERNTLNKDQLSEDEYANEYVEIKEKTYKIAKLMDLKKIVMMFILLIVVVFMSGVTENANIYFVLFYFAMCVFTYSSLDNVFTMIDKNKENTINQTKFYNLINEINEKTRK